MLLTRDVVFAENGNGGFVAYPTRARDDDNASHHHRPTYLIVVVGWYGFIRGGREKCRDCVAESCVRLPVCTEGRVDSVFVFTYEERSSLGALLERMKHTDACVHLVGFSLGGKTVLDALAAESNAETPADAHTNASNPEFRLHVYTSGSVIKPRKKVSRARTMPAYVTYERHVFHERDIIELLRRLRDAVLRPFTAVKRWWQKRKTAPQQTGDGFAHVHLEDYDVADMSAAFRDKNASASVITYASCVKNPLLAHVCCCADALYAVDETIASSAGT